MLLTKRNFLKYTTMATGMMGLSTMTTNAQEHGSSDDGSMGLKSITADVAPISVEERLKRISRAQSLMAKNNFDAIILEPGSAMLYFTGIRWSRSERLTAVIIPKEGDIGIVTPVFEEPSVRESMTFGDDVRTWNEHDDPFERVAGILKDRGINQGTIGYEDTVRYFVVKGLQQQSSAYKIKSALPVTLGCRMYKSEHEIALMRKASEVTLKAYRHVFTSLDKGMTPDDVNAMMRSAQAALGGSAIWNMALFDQASAYPHGSNQKQEIKEGGIVLMDCGCAVQGYQSDISRTFVYGEPSKRQREVWQTVRKGQQIAFETALPGRPAGAVDDAVRSYYEKLGYGPGYKTPGLSHRTGHGIGMDGHESVNFVHGEKTPLAAGMCFSNEPGIYIFGEFGVRLEDCIYMTEKGPEWFTSPPPSLDDPLGQMG